MKGAILPNHVPDTNFQLLIIGMPIFTIITLSGLEDELNTTTLPDRTVASGGNRNAHSIDIDIPVHHRIEQAALELWFKSAQDPVSPGYKKFGTLVYRNINEVPIRTFTVLGVFPTKRALPEGKMDGEGEMQNVTWTLSIDDVLPI